MDLSKKGTFVVPFPARDERTPRSDRVYALDRWLAGKFLRGMGNPALRITLWNGESVSAAGTTPQLGLIIRDRGALWRLLTNPLLHFGDDYSAGRIEIEGGLVAVIETVYRAMEQMPRFQRNSDPAAYRRHQPRLNSMNGSRHNIHHHYDIGNDFYRLWLDAEMLYTCSYFPHPDASLEEAQRAKMELVCRKLRLQAGQEVVEAGCGWGGLARYMAKNYGVKVRAYNISREQIVYARQRATEEGLSGQVEYVEDDYRHIRGSYDAFVAVGMLEHVGPDHYQELGRIIDRSLRKDGLGLIHTIGQNRAAPLSPWFLQRIFPGSYPPTLREMMALFEPCAFSVLDVENLRLHYARTCEHWLARFEGEEEKVREMFDESFVRAWRLYLSGCVANFRLGDLQLYQVVFARAANNQIPWTRNHLTVP